MKAFKNFTLIDASKMSEEEWQFARSQFSLKGCIGGSDCAVLLGLSKYKSPISLFYNAIGLVPLPSVMNNALLHGKQLEDYVAKCWQYYDGTDEGWIANTLANNKVNKYRKYKKIIVNPKYPALAANIDGIITKFDGKKSEHGILEIKTISGYASDSYVGGIPPSYVCQINHYMLVTGFKWACICYLKDGRELGRVVYEADPIIQNAILESANEFQSRVLAFREATAGITDKDRLWQIASQYEPDADASDDFNRFISEKHKQREEEINIIGEEAENNLALEYVTVSSEIKSLEENKQLLQNKLKQHMEKQGATSMTLPSGKITWRKSFLVKLKQ